MIEQNAMDSFIDYVVFDDLGDIIGIQDNAPQSAKKAYKEFMEEQEEAHNNGIDI